MTPEFIFNLSNLSELEIKKANAIVEKLFDQEPIEAGNFRRLGEGTPSQDYADRMYRGIYLITDETDSLFMHFGIPDSGADWRPVADRIVEHLDGKTEFAEMVGQVNIPTLKVRTLRVDDQLLREHAEAYGYMHYGWSTILRISKSPNGWDVSKCV
jgi:hypothetical protein